MNTILNSPEVFTGLEMIQRNVKTSSSVGVPSLSRSKPNTLAEWANKVISYWVPTCYEYIPADSGTPYCFRSQSCVPKWRTISLVRNNYGIKLLKVGYGRVDPFLLEPDLRFSGCVFGIKNINWFKLVRMVIDKNICASTQSWPVKQHPLLIRRLRLSRGE